MNEIFRVVAQKVSKFVGSSYAFILALLIIIIWATTGPIFNYSDTWQLVINTGTTIVTFLIVFLIQNTQNRDTKAINLKLDEIILSTTRAKNKIIDAEEFDDSKLDSLHDGYRKIAHQRQS